MWLPSFMATVASLQHIRVSHAAALTEAFGLGRTETAISFFLIVQEPAFKMWAGFAQAQAPAHHLVFVV